VKRAGVQSTCNSELHGRLPEGGSLVHPRLSLNGSSSGPSAVAAFQRVRSEGPEGYGAQRSVTPEVYFRTRVCASAQRFRLAVVVPTPI